MQLPTEGAVRTWNSGVCCCDFSDLVRCLSKYPPAKPGAYMRLRKSRVFSWSFFRGIFYRTIAFVKDVVRAVEQREACVCIHGMIALFAWPRRAVNPRSPQGRAVGARG
jgi:hypothetical protein